jgi:carbon starvation protein
MHLPSTPGDKAQELRPKLLNPAFALVTLVPLMWLLTVTLTAGWQKIFHEETRPGYPRVGFLQMAREFNEKLPALQQAVEAARTSGEAKALRGAELAVKNNRALYFNNMLDAVVAGIFLTLVAFIFLLSVREWILLLARRRMAVLIESPPVWLPQYAVAESQPLKVLTLLALGFALLKELSGEAHLDRARQVNKICDCQHPDALQSNRASDGRLYVAVTEERFNGIRRCC